MEFPKYIAEEDLYLLVSELFISGGVAYSWTRPPGDGGRTPDRYSDALTIALYHRGATTGTRYRRCAGGWRIDDKYPRYTGLPTVTRMRDPDFFRDARKKAEEQ
jgi:hypothetical protein